MNRSLTLGLALAVTLPVHATITVVGGLPSSPVIVVPNNADSGTGDGATNMAPPGAGITWHIKGNSFVLATPATINSITVRIDENNAITDGTGSITTSFYNLSGTPDSTAQNGQVPTGAAIHTQTDALPTVALGNYLQIALDTPLNLAAGNYGFALGSTDVQLAWDLNTSGTYAEGEVIRSRSDTGAWQDRANDMVFALDGTASAFTLGNPATWPSTFLENGPRASGDSIGIFNAADAGQAGQSFSLLGDADVDSVVIQLDDAAASTDLSGSLTLEIFAAGGSGLPTGPALASLTGELPAGLTTGSYIEFDLPGLVPLPLGDYVLALSTSDLDLVLNSTPGDLYPGGALLESTIGGWTASSPAGRDLVFGLTGNIEIRPPAGSGPNILVILADDFGWTDLSSGKPNLGNGSDFYQTPHLDRLADEGLSFRYCFVHPNCAPTRAALLSGQYAPRSGNGVYNVTSLNRGNGTPALTPPSQREDVPAAHHTMAEMLFDAGYVTCHVGKYHVGNKDGGASTSPENQGFDVNFGGGSAGAPGSFFASASGVFQSPTASIDAFGAQYNAGYITPTLTAVANGNNPATLAGTNKHLTDAEADAVISFLSDHQSGPLSSYPFYVQYHAYAVHTPIQPRPDIKTKYDGLTQGTRHTNRSYAALVEGLDQSVGRILNYLDATGLANDTLVIFLTDNGGHEGPTDNVPLRSRKGSFYNGGIRVPMIVRQPGTVPQNQVTDTLVHAVDLFPTLMQVAGGSTTEILDGTSFYDHVLDPAASPRHREPIFYHFPGYLDNRARPSSTVIKDSHGTRFKLIYNYDFTYDPNTNDDAIMVLTQPWELYDITNDLSESTNLIDGNYWNWLIYGAIADEMAADLNAWLNQSDPTWNAKQPTSGGTPVPYAPAGVPDVTVSPTQVFRITNVTINRIIDEAAVTFTSSTGFDYGIEATSTPQDPASWTALVTGIPGQPGTTTKAINDPGIGSNFTRFYRATVRSR